MDSVLLLLFKSAVWLASFALVFLVFLRNERFFRLNRFFLLSGLAAALFLPLVTVKYTVSLEAISTPVKAVTGSVASQASGMKTEESPADIIVLIYISGVVLFSLIFLLKSHLMFRTLKKSSATNLDNVRLVRHGEYSGSFSFFSWVFVNPSATEPETREIVNHELVHINQKHWIDLLIAQFICIVQWMNPFSWLYIHFIRQNHEYLADEGALQRTLDPALYRAALLNQVIGLPVFSLSNSFNYSLTKKRFKMMKNISTSPYRKMRVLLILPVMLLILAAFAKPEYKSVSPALTSGTSETVISNQDQGLVKGVVIQSDGKPLEGAIVLIKASTIGTSSDVKGNFSLSKVPADATLVVSFVGFKTKVVKASFSSAMKIVMVRDTIVYQGGSTPPPPPPPPAPSNKKNVSSGVGEQKVVKDVFVVIEELPQFPGGSEELVKWIGSNVKYPGEAAKNKIMGKVFVEFVVGKDGKISNAKVANPVHPLLDAEALRVINLMPAWKPGTQSGKPVDVYMKLPIDFKLN